MSADPNRLVSNSPLVAYGTTASYYTGKLEAYLRAKGIAYRLEPFSPSNMRRCADYTGVLQIPQVECPDGSWLVDTTLILEHFERVRPEPAVSPRAPAVAFVSRLIEDYADEWLWRPAPGRILRERAPGVLEWVARMWNLRPARLEAAPLPERLPEDLAALLDPITGVYLPYLEANAAAYAKGERRVRYAVRGVPFAEPTKPYRVWCCDRLQRELCGLDAADRAEVERALGASEALARLAVSSPRPVPDLVGPLPLTAPPRGKAVDSWWRS